MQNIGKDVDLVKLVKQAYALSRPQGMGFLHFQEGDLTDDEAKQLFCREQPNGRIAVSLDYVKGRACKLTVFRDNDGMMYVPDRWYDHGSFDDLFATCGITPEPRVEPAPLDDGGKGE